MRYPEPRVERRANDDLIDLDGQGEKIEANASRAN